MPKNASGILRMRISAALLAMTLDRLVVQKRRVGAVEPAALVEAVNHDQGVFTMRGIPQVVRIRADKSHGLFRAIVEGEQHLGAYPHGTLSHLGEAVLTQRRF